MSALTEFQKAPNILRCLLLDGGSGSGSGGARSRRAAARWDPCERPRSRECSVMRRRFPEAEFPV